MSAPTFLSDCIKRLTPFTMTKVPLLIFILAIMAGRTDGGKILFLQVLTSYSHQVAMWPYSNGLIERGHEVTWLTPFQPKPGEEIKHENFTLVHAPELEKLVAKIADLNMVEIRFTGRRTSPQIIWPEILDLAYTACETLIQEPTVKRWIESQMIRGFDLVVIDGSNNDCGLGLTHLFKSRHILFDTTVPYPWQYDIFGFSPESSWIPDFQYGFPQPISFFNRVHNAILPISWHLWKKLFHFPKLRTLFTREFKTEFPDFEEMYSNTSLVLTNTHFSEEYARSLPPWFVSVGGIHIQTDKQDFSKPLASPQQIPEHVRNFTRKFPRGYIYISFGSYVSSKDMPPKFRTLFFRMMRQFPHLGFVWRWNTNTSTKTSSVVAGNGDSKKDEDVPENLLFVPWMPQQAILSDQKLVAFISHSGMLSTLEAIYFGVPTISIGIFWEQVGNSQRTGRMGRGVTLELQGLTQIELDLAVAKILTDDSYKKKMMSDSKLFRDRPEHPLHLAIWWTEYALRHKDNSALKPLGIHQTWYQRRLLDVWAFILVVMVTAGVTITIFLFKLLCFIFRRISTSPSSFHSRMALRKKSP